MTKTMRGRLLAAVLLLTGPHRWLRAAASRARDAVWPSFTQPQPFAWWKSEPFKKELGLTADQSARIDKIWETTRPELRQEWDELSEARGQALAPDSERRRRSRARPPDRPRRNGAREHEQDPLADAGADAEDADARSALALQRAPRPVAAGSAAASARAIRANRVND